jgi:heme-degrading monooxygenase HmoA
MSIVRINAIDVPEGMGEMLEQRFAQRLGAVDRQPGFEGFELLRPTGEAERRYFVVTHWRSVEDFDNWVSSADFGKGHAHAGGQQPVGTGSAVLEFDVVMRSTPS